MFPFRMVLRRIAGNQRCILCGAKWTLSLSGVGTVAVVAGVILSASPVAREVDSMLGVSMPKAASSVWRFTEGCAISHFGGHGLNPCVNYEGIDAAEAVFLHGDSYVEALQVSDECKPDAVMAKALGGRVPVVGVGRSGAGFPSMIVRARAFEQAFGVPKFHVFFSANIDGDVFGDEGDEFVRTADGIAKCSPKVSARQQQMINLINRFHMNCLLSVWTGMQSVSRKRWHFLPRFAKPKGAEAPRTKDLAAELGFLCAQMHKDISAPIVVAYCPSVPTIRKGRVSVDDENASDAAMAKDVFAANGIGFIDVTPAMLGYWKDRGGFVRGFGNSLGPGRGHLNEHGVEFVFSYVARILKERYGF